MVDYAVVAPGGVTVREGDLESLRRAAAALAEGECLWADLDAPGRDELARVLAALGLPAFRLDDRAATRHRPRVDRVGDAAVIVVKTLWYLAATRQVETGDLVVCTDGRALVTVRGGEADPVGPARDRLAADARLRADGAGAAVYAVFDEVAEAYAGALESLSDDVDDIEREVFSPVRSDCIARIYSLIRETLEFQNAVKPLVPFARRARQRRGAAGLGGARMREVAEHLLRIDAQVDTCMNLLTTVLTAHQGQIATWQNEDMRKISAWAAIAVVPTVIAGIYGMNFDHMPELHWTLGYPLVLAVMAAACLLLYRGFRRNGWL